MTPPILPVFQRFAQSVTAKFSQLLSGAPEDQLRGPFETLRAMDETCHTLK